MTRTERITTSCIALARTKMHEIRRCAEIDLTGSGSALRSESAASLEYHVRAEPQGNTPEIVLNVAMAELLRRHGLEAEAEQSLHTPAGRHQVDVLVELGEYAIAVEAEFAPARTVLADAGKRLPAEPLTWRGLTVDLVFALVYPASLRNVTESRVREALAASDGLEFCLVERRAGSSPRPSATAGDKRLITGSKQSGSIATLAEYLHNYWIRTAKGGSVEETAKLASFGIERATSILKRPPGLHPLANADSDPEATCALIWLNALLFQELLERNLEPSLIPRNKPRKRIPRPDPTGSPSALLQQWEAILKINWWPIFHVARQALRFAPPRPAKLALEGLVRVAAKIAEKGTVRRHDVAGRILHRLLGTRKFLATNYTTIPAAVMLAGLAFAREHVLWSGKDWTARETYENLRIVDPACGSGTLLMAALQELLKLRRRGGAGAVEEPTVMRALLEEALHGYDVVPAAVHLTAATLSMAETSQLISNMPLYWMPHDVHKGKARMGSLDFLLRSPSKGVAQHLPMFAEEGRDPSRVTGEGAKVYDAYMPRNCDVVIANPPFTRAGGPGTAENTAWNPIFGSALNNADKQLMTETLKRTLHVTPASLYAGLGSAFAVLAEESLREGGRLAFVLPATVLTGSGWTSIRDMLLHEFAVDWVVVSHDKRSRSAKPSLPGRLFVAFSESTRIAEALIVATRSKVDGPPRTAVTKFVNLRHNPDEPIDAMAIVRALLSMPFPSREKSVREILIGDTSWGEVIAVEQNQLADGPWPYSTFTQAKLIAVAEEIVQQNTWTTGHGKISVPTACLSNMCDLGPYHMQVKNPKQGLFKAIETSDPTRLGHPGLWHHSSKKLFTLELPANARLTNRDDRDSDAQERMISRSSRLHIASALRHAPQRLAAALTEEPALGFSSWISLTPTKPFVGKEEALCLWFNSTLGLLLRIAYSNRPYLGRSGLPHKVARNLPVLDIDSLASERLGAAKDIFDSLKHKPLRGFAHLADDPVRRELDRRLLVEVLGHDSRSDIDKLATALNREPTITTRQ